MVTERVRVERGETDKYGNRNKVSDLSADVVFAWSDGSQSGRFGEGAGGPVRGESASFTGLVYVEKGTDLRARDRLVRASGEKYAVVGHSLWNQLDPFGGYDFGWVAFQVEAVNG